MDEFISKLQQLLQVTYFKMYPTNPNHTEDGFQELLRHNITKIFKYNVDSESTNQKIVKDINDHEIHLKNKTERYDLLIRDLELIMELKAVEKIDDSHVNQLLSYMNNTSYKYGILINFRKGKSCKQLLAEARIYEKKELKLCNDKYGHTYQKYDFVETKRIETEDFKEVVGDFLPAMRARRDPKEIIVN